MTGRKTTVLLAAALAVVLIGAAALYRALSGQTASAPPEAQSSAEELPAAPDFTVVDVDGGSAAFSDRAGTPVVLNFWASWCSPCKKEMPVFDAAAAQFAGQVDFWMVNLTDGSRETMERASRFIEEQGYTFPVFYDTLQEGAEAYAVRSIPVTYFIDAQGRVQAYSAGSMDEETLRRGIDLIVEQEG